MLLLILRREKCVKATGSLSGRVLRALCQGEEACRSQLYVHFLYLYVYECVCLVLPFSWNSDQ